MLADYEIENISVGGFTGGKFFELFVIVAFIGPELAEQSMMPGDVKPLILGEEFGGADGVVIGFRIQRPEHGRLFAADAGHLGKPARDFHLIWRGIGLDLGEQMIVFPLQVLMIAGAATEVEHELGSTNGGDQCADRAAGHIHVEDRHELCDCFGTEQDDEEVEPTVPAIERQPSRRVIERVAQYIEADQIAVHFLPHFFGPGADGAGATGWRGPWPAPGFGGAMLVIVGWRGPKLFCTISGCLGPALRNSGVGWRGPGPSCAETGCLGPLLKFPFSSFDIEIVLIRLARLGMPGAGLRCCASRHRQTPHPIMRLCRKNINPEVGEQFPLFTRKDHTMTQHSSEDTKIISAMADEMLRLGEGCTEDQVANRFTRDEIKKYGEDARTLANQRAQREAA